MINVETKVRVEGLVAYRIYRFFLRPRDADPPDGWSGSRLKLEMVRRSPSEVGSVVAMDETIGERRVRIRAVVIEAVPGRCLVLQMKKLIRLPAWLAMSFRDVDGGVVVSHALRVGWRGPGILLDPFLRLYFNRRFRRALAEHLRTEFQRLQPLLHVDTSEW